MQFEVGAQMVLNAFLLTVADISLDTIKKLPVVIFLEMQIGPSNGILVKNTNQFEVIPIHTTLQNSHLVLLTFEKWAMVIFMGWQETLHDSRSSVLTNMRDTVVCAILA